VLDVLARGEHSVSAILVRLDISQPALSQHLKVLREVGLVQQRKNGKERIYSLDPRPLEEISDWLTHYEEFWKKKVAALGEHLERKHGPRVAAPESSTT
jgi:DNA-binding transcriptional ArsR family regulator